MSAHKVLLFVVKNDMDQELFQAIICLNEAVNGSKERFCTRTMARDPIPGITIDTRAQK